MVAMPPAAKAKASKFGGILLFCRFGKPGFRIEQNEAGAAWAWRLGWSKGFAMLQFVGLHCWGGEDSMWCQGILHILR